jgi:DNA-binding transcriptional LysR family regulator
VESTGFEHALDGEHVDLAVTGSLQVSADILREPLYGHRFTVIVSQDCALQDRISDEQFAQMEHVLFAPHGARRSWLREDLEARGLGGRIRLSTPHHLIVPLLVEREAALAAVVPQLLADTYTRFARVKILQPDFPLPRIEVYQYWHRRYDADPFHRWLRSFVRDRLYRNPALHIP